jgi:putative spermidine/putrescine transport system permease protein
VKRRIDWSKWGLGTYFVLFLIFLYAPMILMGILSFQGQLGSITWPFRGPLSLDWWKSLFDASIPGSHADEIRASGRISLWVSLASGVIVSLLAFSLSMAFRRKFRGEGVAFYLVMLALMTPGFLVGLGTQLFWSWLGNEPTLWKTALGANVVWGIPFGFLVMLAVWNRYDERVEEAARDLGASAGRTFREVTLPLVWTGLFGSFLFGVTLSWNEYDRTALLLASGQATLPIQIFSMTVGSVIRPDLYALGTATTVVTLLAVGIFLVVAAVVLRRRVRRVVAAREEFGEIATEVPDAAGLGAGARAS